MSQVVQILLFTLCLALAAADSSVKDEFCRFSEEIKNLLKNIKCNNDWDDCAMQAREIVQGLESGTWGAVVVSKQDIVDLRVEWNISKIYPDPPHCRLLVNENMLMQLFRTGYEKKDVNKDQKFYLKEKMKLPETLEYCPHTILQQIISSFSVEEHAVSPKFKSGTPNVLHEAVKRLSSLVYDEIGNQWNILIVDDRDTPVKLGFSFPHYIYDSHAGFCIVRTKDGYYVNAAAVGYADENAENRSRGK